MKRKIFINLTNGLEAMEREGFDSSQVNFMRIQSTYCEGKQWELLLQDLDHNFLMWAALGYECVVYDYGSNHPVAKAIFMGLEWIRFTVNKIWFNRTIVPYMKEKQVFSMFESEYRKLSKRTINKLEYYKKFVKSDNINIVGIHAETDKDDDINYYVDIVNKKF
jgi:hypothetical protein